MSALLKKATNALLRDGVAKTAMRIIRDPRRAGLLALPAIEDRFTRIFELNHWGSSESVSGIGSELAFTKNLRTHLPVVFDRFSVHTVLDVPCGDFNWMRHVLAIANVRYIGGDIVKPLVDRNTAAFGSTRVKFVHLDLTKDALPAAELLICRDCLFHLSYADVRRVLDNFVRSEIPYLLSTTFLDRPSIVNRDIVTGDFRPIDLFAMPFGLPSEVLYRFDDWIPPHPPREMCLWSRTQIAASLNQPGR